MKFLSSSDVQGKFTRFGKLLYCRTPYSNFNYGQGVANKIAWRFYWITPNNTK